ncbi:hypothetical protein EG328_001815 [Venturia inaequalis]|uniref:Velvet domain-containing protein n=1 Tax=Venturia inaequalis TaxID=5025 RepID=A0A8H3UYH3_VENIN|nr:hypothetical protein EG328_001815 [Venturia inaequalis]
MSIADSISHHGPGGSSIFFTSFKHALTIEQAVDAISRREAENETEAIVNHNDRPSQSQVPALAKVNCLTSLLSLRQEDSNITITHLRQFQPPIQWQTPAVTLQVRTVRRGSSAAVSNQNLPQYFVVVSLLQLSADGDVKHASTGILAGTQIAAIHAPDHATLRLNSPDILGYVSFPNLVILSPGTYRLRTSLMKVTSSDGSSFLHSEDSGLIAAS